MSHITRYGTTRRWSVAVVFGGVAYFVEVADDLRLDSSGQIRQVFQQVESRLNELNSDLSRLLQVLIYLPDPADFATFNALWDEWIPDGHAPVRACVHSALASPDLRVELVITAAASKAPGALEVLSRLLPFIPVQ